MDENQEDKVQTDSSEVAPDAPSTAEEAVEESSEEKSEE